jgi:hypothetical protein
MSNREVNVQKAMAQEGVAVTRQRKPHEEYCGYKPLVFGIFHMQRQLHAKESGDAHESSRIWRIPGHCP